MPEKFSASNATKFMHCHASANLDLAIPYWVPPERDPDADNAANRGTKMHKIFADLMSLPIRDMERLTAAADYVAAYRNQRRFKSLIEQTEVAEWLPSAPSTTADLVLYLNDELHIFDLKTGRIPVEANDNDQMLYYAATYLKYAPLAKDVMLHIVQPWAENIAVWKVTRDELFQWMVDAIDHDVLITDGDTEFMPGDHCMFCPANPRGRGGKGRPFCPTLMNMYYPKEPLDQAAVLEVDELDD
jgi:Protein of unknown function (DUF2800)